MTTAWGQRIVAELVHQGVTAFVLSPGSRNAPLAMAAARHPAVTPVVHFDERGAAFFALGVGKATGRPAALVCTSGTATANYLPAVIEAAQSQVPLIVLTADRPPELLDAGANQAIDQIRLYGGYVRWFVDLPCPTGDVPPAYVATTIAQAVYRARRNPAGPVHINCHFREPLYDPAEPPDGPPAVGTRYEQPAPAAVEGPLLADVYDRLRTAQRGLLVLGHRGIEDTQGLGPFIDRLGWPVVADVAAGVPVHAALELRHLDHVLLGWPRAEAGDGGYPDVVVHLGGPLVSKRVAAYLAQRREAYVHVAPHPHRIDPHHTVTHRIDCGIGAFCRGFEDRGAVDPGWRTRLRQLDRACAGALAARLDGQSPLTEPGVARLVARHLPASSALFLGNSMPVRDADSYAKARPVAAYANRGASGIDGNLATAAGLAHGLGAPVTAIIGDLAALHDLNALALIARAPVPVTVVVVNNDGGGIFSFLPAAAHGDVFEQVFGTPHGRDFAHAAALFGLPYEAPATADAFEATYRASAGHRTALIEVKTSRKENHRVHQDLHAAVKAALETV